MSRPTEAELNAVVTVPLTVQEIRFLEWTARAANGADFPESDSAQRKLREAIPAEIEPRGAAMY